MLIVSQQERDMHGIMKPSKISFVMDSQAGRVSPMALAMSSASINTCKQSEMETQFTFSQQTATI